MNAFNIRQYITTTGSTNGQKALEERKENIYKKPHIDLHDMLESWLSLMSTLEEVQKPLEVMGDVNPRRSLEASRSDGCI
jgi:hypothetical protein